MCILSVLDHIETFLAPCFINIIYMYIHHYIRSNTVANQSRPTIVIIEVLATVTTTSNG